MFNLDEYEDVNTRIKRFRTENISGRIECEIIEVDLAKGLVLVKASVYREHEDTVPAAVDYAYGNQAFYRENMKRWFVEDTCTSAVGRAIGLLMPTEHRPTKQNMQQVVDAPKVLDSDPWQVHPPAEGTAEPLATGINLIQGALGGEIIEEIPTCSHGRMIWKEGTSAKTGNKYQGWVCVSKTKPQCPAQWVSK